MPDWYRDLKSERLRNIYARKYPKQLIVYKRKDPEEARKNYSAASQRRWSDPDFREKMKSHPWRQSYPIKFAPNQKQDTMK